MFFLSATLLASDGEQSDAALRFASETLDIVATMRQNDPLQALVLSERLKLQLETARGRLTHPNTAEPRKISQESFFKDVETLHRFYQLLKDSSAVFRSFESAIKLLENRFSQEDFDKIFDHIAPRMEDDLEGLDNSAYESGCQENARFLVEHLGPYWSYLRTRSREIPLYVRNFCVALYLLGCCQNRFGKDSFANFPFPVPGDYFRLGTDALPSNFRPCNECTGDKKAHTLNAYLATVVSTVKKLHSCTWEELRFCYPVQKFAVSYAALPHSASIGNLCDFLKGLKEPHFMAWRFTHLKLEKDQIYSVECSPVQKDPSDPTQQPPTIGILLEFVSFDVPSEIRSKLTEVSSDGIIALARHWGQQTDKKN